MAAGLEEIAALVEKSSSRSEFLESLLQDLSSYEARSLFASLQKRYQYFDVIANLPMEILALVFGYLPFTYCFHLQRVSRAWKAQLSSISLQSSCLAPVFASHFPPLAGETGLSGEEIFTLRGKHVLAVQKGLPYSWGLHIVTTRLGFKRNFLDMWNCDYYNDVFAWIPAAIPGVPMWEGECVKTFNLRTGAQTTYRALDRGKIIFVRILAAHLVLITQAGAAYAFSLQDGNIIDLPLLNANLECVGGRNRHLVVSWADPSAKRTIWVWDLVKHATKALELDHENVDVRSLSVSEDGHYLAVTRVSIRSPGSRLHVMSLKKYHVLSGREMQSEVLRWREWFGNSNRYFDMDSGRLVGRGLRQYHPNGLLRVFEHFIDTLPQYTSIRTDQERYQLICRSLSFSHPHDPRLDTFGSARFRLSIVDLHAANPFPYGQNRPYLFVVSNFDKDVALSGGDKSLIVNEAPFHKYS